MRSRECDSPLRSVHLFDNRISFQIVNPVEDVEHGIRSWEGNNARLRGLDSSWFELDLEHSSSLPLRAFCTLLE